MGFVVGFPIGYVLVAQTMEVTNAVITAMFVCQVRHFPETSQ
jgi:hypothetical protein